MTDSIDLVVRYLKAQGVAGGRVYVKRFPSGYDNTQSAVVVDVRAGGHDLYVQHHNPKLQLKCYGGTNSFAEAAAVYAALYDAFHDKNMLFVKDGSTVLGVITRADAEQFPQLLEEPNLQWPYFLAFWNVEARPN